MIQSQLTIDEQVILGLQALSPANLR